MSEALPIRLPEPKPALENPKRRIRTLWVSGITSLLFLAVTPIIYFFSSDELSGKIWGMGLTALLALASLYSLWEAWRGRVTRAGIFLLASILILSLTTPIIGDGQGIPIGIIIVIIGIGITAASLPPRFAAYGNSASIFIGLLVIALDQFVPSFGLPSQPIYARTFSAVAAVIFLFIIARQFNEFTLRAKLIIAFATVTILPLAVLGTYVNYQSTQALSQASHSRLIDLSAVMANQYDTFLEQQINAINNEARQSVLRDFLLLPTSQRESSAEKDIAQTALETLRRKDIVFIDSYGILDANGKNVLDTSSEDLGRDESGQDYFIKALETGAPYASSILFIEEREKSLYFSAPIKDAANRTLGVLRVEYHADILQSIAQSNANASINIALVDNTNYMRLAYTENRNELRSAYKNFTAAELATLQAAGKMPKGTPEELLQHTNDEVVRGIDQLEQSPFFNAYSPSLKSEAIYAGIRLKNENWSVLVKESSAVNQEAATAQTRNAVLISVGLSLAAILMALGAAQILAAPLTKLTKVAEEISAGDLTARANIATLDEVGALAESFNRMADELSASLNSLEERVTERTLDVEVAKKQTEKRAEELEAISEISKIITSEQNLTTLLTLITRLVSERFGFYHTGIFLIDETRQFAVLQAANSEGGKKMLARGHRLAMGYGIVGYVAKSGIYRIALDVGQDAVYFNNPDMPHTRSEMALPLRVRGKVIGALDAQSEKTNAFSDTDAKNLSILADQISIALENAQLFERTQQALREAQALYRQNLQESWASFSQEESLIGYQQTLQGGEQIKSPLESEEIRETLNRGATLFFESSAEHREPLVVVPIKLREQVIGVVRVKAPSEERQWTKDEVNLIESISERLSIALENARLIEESQRQVVKQQTIRNMTEKISASIDLKNVLQTAVEELGRALPGSEVVLKLSEEDSQPKETQERQP